MNAGGTMQTPRILIVYGTRYGQTAKIAERIGATLAAIAEVTVADSAHPSADIDPEHYDGVLVGGSLIGRGHQRSIKRYVMRHLARLNAMPSGFFSVSGSAASKEPQGQADARREMQRFLTETRWEPDLMTTFGAAIKYTKYSWLIRLVLREICRRNGGPTDTSRDHELTDWEAVSAFAKHFTRVVSPAPEVMATAVQR
jgi:menaquinone-dependent protoporphyrinogen oxidase